MHLANLSGRFSVVSDESLVKAGGGCAQKGVIYQLECLTCGDLYIRESGRVVGSRVKEHLAGKRRQSLLTPLLKHRREAHSGDDSM